MKVPQNNFLQKFNRVISAQWCSWIFFFSHLLRLVSVSSRRDCSREHPGSACISQRLTRSKISFSGVLCDSFSAKIRIRAAGLPILASLLESVQKLNHWPDLPHIRGQTPGDQPFSSSNSTTVRRTIVPWRQKCWSVKCTHFRPLFASVAVRFGCDLSPQSLHQTYCRSLKPPLPLRRPRSPQIWNIFTLSIFIL